MSGYYQPHFFDGQVGASPQQIGQAVQIRNQYSPGHPVRIEANKIGHSQDYGVKNAYTTNNYAPSPQAQKFIKQYLP